MNVHKGESNYEYHLGFIHLGVRGLRRFQSARQQSYRQTSGIVKYRRDSGHAPKNNQGQGQSGIKPNTTEIDPQIDAPKVKGIYVTAYSAGGSRMNQLVDLMDKTELNAMVIDIKDDEGYITYKTDNPKLKELGKSQPLSKISNS